MQFGNESSTGSETQEGKILRFVFATIGSRNRPRGVLQLGRRPGERRVTRPRFSAASATTSCRGGVQYLRQERDAGPNDVADQTIDIWSGFVVWDQAEEGHRVRPPGRREGDLADVETGFPGADGSTTGS